MTPKHTLRQPIRHLFHKIIQRLDRIEATLRTDRTIYQLVEGAEMATLDDIKTKVEQARGVQESAITLLQSLHQQLSDALASNDPAKMQEILDALDSETNNLAAAVEANTPAASA